MKKSWIRIWAAALAMTLLPLAAYADLDLVDDQLSIGSAASLGYQNTDVDGDRPSQFEAYREVPEGFVFDHFMFKGEWNDPNNPFYLKFFGRDLVQDDQNLCLEVGRYGTFKLKFNYKETPRLISTGNRFLESYQGNGDFTLADATQLTLEGTAATDFGTNATNAAYRAALAGFVNTAGTVDIGFDRQTSKVDYLHHIAPGLDFRIKFMHENKEGDKIASSGVYHRSTAVANYERFRTVVFELPEPVDYDSDVLNAGLEASGEGWTAGFTYTFQNFENNINTLTWDNPFWFTPRAGAGATALGISSGRGIMDLPPDMYSHAGALTGSVELPMSSRFTGTVSVGGTWQEDPLIPYSANTAMVTDVAATPATTLARPRGSLDGFVMNFVQNYVLTSRPIDPLTLTAKYRYYYYDNKTDQIHFPGYAELADSQWHAGDVDTKTPSWRKHNAGLEADYEITSAVSVRGVYAWEQMNRQGRNVEEANEHAVGAGITVRPASWVKALVDYRWSNRDAGDYDSSLAQSGEHETSRQWDQNDRSRHDVKASATLDLMEALELCVDTSYVYDSYNPSRLGLRRGYGWEAGGELSYTPAEFITIAANYSHEDYRSRINGGGKTTALNPGGTPFFTDANFFHTKTTDRADNAGICVSGDIMPGRIEFETGYNYTRTKGKLYTFNPNPSVAGDTISSSRALPYSDTKTVNHEVRADLTYRFLKHFAINLRYLYENFEVDDLAWKDMDNQINTVVLDGVVVNDTTRVLLLNNQFSDYQAHVGAVLFSYIF